MFRMETKKENAHRVSSSRRALESHPSFSNASERPAAKRRKTHTPNDSTEIDFDSVKNVSEIQVWKCLTMALCRILHTYMQSFIS
jgi:hypothetical protein